MVEVTEKTQIQLVIPHLDTDEDLQNFLIDDDIERIIMQLIMWSAIIMLANIWAW